MNRTSDSPLSPVLEFEHHTLVVADVHLQLDHTHPINQHFLYFLAHQATQAEALYILGDLFESWVGDDVSIELYKSVIQAVKQLTQNGVHVYFQYGNRDFLMGDHFCQETGAAKLDAIHLATLYGTRYIMLHGDELCTDDIEYQRFKKWVRNPVIQFLFLRLSRTRRLRIADTMRTRSKNESAAKQADIMDVNAKAVESLFESYPEIQHIIHGHTHRPQLHTITMNKQIKQRWVLGDWRPESKIMVISKQGPALIDY